MRRYESASDLGKVRRTARMQSRWWPCWHRWQLVASSVEGSYLEDSRLAESTRRIQRCWSLLRSYVGSWVHAISCSRSFLSRLRHSKVKVERLPWQSLSLSVVGVSLCQCHGCCRMYQPVSCWYIRKLSLVREQTISPHSFWYKETLVIHLDPLRRVAAR